MTRLLYVVPVLLAFVVTAAQEEYPHAFPRKGATQLIDNERVTVWEVTWLNGVRQPIHRHRYDMIGVYLRYGPITVTRPDGTTTPPGQTPPTLPPEPNGTTSPATSSPPPM